mgnify:CR=1 FL=1
MMVPDFAVVIPVYNENENLPELIGRIYHDVRCRPRFFIQEICGANPSSIGKRVRL